MTPESKRARLGMELLEDRRVLSTYVNPSGDLVITEGNGNDVVTVSSWRWFTTVTENGASTSYYNWDIWSDKIIFYGGKGNDRFTNTTSDLRVLGYGGEGDDRMIGNNQADELYGDSANYYNQPLSWYNVPGHDTLVGGGGNDNLYGQGGNDQIIGGAGSDCLYGGDGDDTLVTIDGALYEYADGGDGRDTLWTDKITGGQWWTTDWGYGVEVQQEVTGFANGADLTLDGDRIIDPLTSKPSTGDLAGAGTYRRFSNNPLFASGSPTYFDIRQGQIGDCWMLAKLGAAANDNPGSVQSMVADFGDGTYGVKLGNKFYRVDDDLPVLTASSTAPHYAQLGNQNSMWVAIVEKAYANYRSSLKNLWFSDYAALHGGWSSEATTAFGGIPTTRMFSSYANATDLASDIADRWNNYDMVTVSWPGDDTRYILGGRLVDGHVYTVAWIEWGANGAIDKIVLRNPWGIDVDTSDGGVASGTNDGFVAVTPAELFGIGKARVEWGKV